MRNFIIIAIISLLFNHAFAQVKSENSVQISRNSADFKVEYVNKNEAKSDIAYFVNGKQVHQSVIGYINPKAIADIKVEKEAIEIDHIKYSAKFLIETKDDYQPNPNLISLTQLRLKYTTVHEDPIIFQIDNEIVNADYDAFLVDVNYILKVVVDKLDSSKVNVIRLISKTEENIRKSKTIMIRGGDVL